MAHHKADQDRIANDRNTPRFCVENQQITWVLMIGVILWGIYGYFQMPKRKDPKFGATRAAVVCPWPGVSADKVEQLVTKKIEAKIAGNVKILNIQSVSRDNLSVVQIALEESTVSDVNKQYDDIALRLNTIDDLPEGAGPVTFLRDFGETAALMLTVSSPKAGAAEIAWRSDRIREVLQAERAKARAGRRSAGIICFPLSSAQQFRDRIGICLFSMQRTTIADATWSRSRGQASSASMAISDPTIKPPLSLPISSSRRNYDLQKSIPTFGPLPTCHI